jgi:hypothetical protein
MCTEKCLNHAAPGESGRRWHVYAQLGLRPVLGLGYDYLRSLKGENAFPENLSTHPC